MRTRSAQRSSQRERAVDGARDPQRVRATALVVEALQQLEQQVDVLDGALGVEERALEDVGEPARRPSAVRAAASPAVSARSIAARRAGFSRSARASGPDRRRAGGDDNGPRGAPTSSS